MKHASYFISLILISYICFSCTISFQNVSTNGKATDVVDEGQGASADVSPNINIPATPLGYI